MPILKVRGENADSVQEVHVYDPPGVHNRLVIAFVVLADSAICIRPAPLLRRMSDVSRPSRYIE